MWAIAVPESMRVQFGHRVPEPSAWFEVTAEWLAVSWVCADPPREDRPKQGTYWLMIETALVNALSGKRWPKGQPNPFLGEGLATFRLNAYVMGDMRSHMEQRGVWDTWDRDEARRKAGQMTTQSQSEARRLNIAKAREAAAAKRREAGDAAAARRLSLVESGATREQVAKRLGIAKGSVSATVSRDRARVRRMSADDLAALDWNSNDDLTPFLRAEA